MAMRKYAIGDRVRINDGESEYYRGRVGAVTGVVDSNPNYCLVLLDSGDFGGPIAFFDHHLDPESTVITSSSSWQ